ncbi:MAG: hypothetical protein ABFS38_13630 [Bacteroidota bacterium]
MNKRSIILLLFVFAAGFSLSHFEIFPFSKKATSDEEIAPVNSEQTTPFYDYTKIELDEIISVSPENASAIRSKTTHIIFGTPQLPSGVPDSVYSITDTLYNDISNLKSIEQYKVIQNYNIHSVGYIFHPREENHRLFIYHQGHNGDFLLGKHVIEFFVNKGFTVYAFCMPLLGKNNEPVVTVDKIGTFKLKTGKGGHELMKFLDHPISFFVTPVLTMINYAQSYNYKDITMCGISGGGWTTTLVSALDTRINNSFPVAGTYPMYIKLNAPPKSYGDFEQVYPPLYRQVGYLDMYILGATGKDRFQVQILNLHDPCCFDGRYSEHYEPFVQERVKEFEGGSFEVISDTVNQEHRISEFSMEKIYEKLIQVN